MIKKQLPIAGSWSVPATHTTCPVTMPGIPLTWAVHDIHPSVDAVPVQPRPVILCYPNGAKSQIRCLPSKPFAGQVAPSDAIEADLIQAEDLDPLEIAMLEYLLHIVEPVLVSPNNKTFRQAAIQRLHGDRALADSIAQKVFTGIEANKVLQPAQLRVLFRERVSRSTIQRDLRAVRRTQAREKTEGDASDIQTGELATVDSAQPSTGTGATGFDHVMETNVDDEEAKATNDDILSTARDEDPHFSAAGSVLARLKEAIPALPEARELFEGIRQRYEREGRAQEILQETVKYLLRKKDAVKNPEAARKIGMKVLKKWRSLNEQADGGHEDLE